MLFLQVGNDRAPWVWVYCFEKELNHLSVIAKQPQRASHRTDCGFPQPASPINGLSQMGETISIAAPTYTDKVGSTRTALPPFLSPQPPCIVPLMRIQRWDYCCLWLPEPRHEYNQSYTRTCSENKCRTKYYKMPCLIQVTGRHQWASEGHLRKDLQWVNEKCRKGLVTEWNSIT